MSNTTKQEVDRYDPSLPLARASTPPSSWYIEPAFHTLDRDAVMAGNWILAARLEQLAEKGQFVTADIAGEPILLVNNGRIEAFYNVCRHHAARVAEGEGSTAAFHCPYHGWTYNLDGSLRSTPNLGDAEEFDMRCNGLVPIRCETVGAFVFICLDENAPAFHVYAGKPDFVDDLALRGLSFHARVEYEIACNWKVYVDNYLDGGYHVPVLHRGLNKALDNSQYRVELIGRVCLQACPTSASNEVRTGDASYYWLYPNVMFNFYEGMVDVNLVVPMAADRCRVVFDFYFDGRAEHTAEFIRESIGVADEVQREDQMICESVQRGLGSRAYDTGRLSPLKEAGEQLFHRLLHDDYKQYLDAALSP